MAASAICATPDITLRSNGPIIRKGFSPLDAIPMPDQNWSRIDHTIIDMDPQNFVQTEIDKKYQGRVRKVPIVFWIFSQLFLMHLIYAI